MMFCGDIKPDGYIDWTHGFTMRMLVPRDWRAVGIRMHRRASMYR